MQESLKSSPRKINMIFFPWCILLAHHIRSYKLFTTPGISTTRYTCMIIFTLQCIKSNKPHCSMDSQYLIHVYAYIVQWNVNIMNICCQPVVKSLLQSSAINEPCIPFVLSANNTHIF